MAQSPTLTWKELLNDWKGHSLEPLLSRRRALDELLPAFRAAVDKVRIAQRTTAEEFNLFSVLDLVGDERRHSRALEWLLNPKETHAQGSLGLRILLDRLGLSESYAQHMYYVRREVSGRDSRIDLEVGARNTFLIHFENKIWSRVGDRQLLRETDDLKRRALDLQISGENVHAYFLTPTGWMPEVRDRGVFRPLRWSDIAEVFERFAERAHAPSVKWFTEHYAMALRRFVAMDDEEVE